MRTRALKPDGMGAVAPTGGARLTPSRLADAAAGEVGSAGGAEAETRGLGGGAGVAVPGDGGDAGPGGKRNRSGNGSVAGLSVA
jgi:hypothetical protein